jgi:hypothetical protein
LKHVITEGLNNPRGPQGEIELNLPDQHIFALEIRADKAYKNPAEMIVLKDYEWGDTPVYGAGLNPSILPTTFFGNLDLSMRSGDMEKDMLPFTAAIGSRFAGTIGGSVTNTCLKDAEVYILAQQVVRSPTPMGPFEIVSHTEVIDGKLHRYHNGETHRLIPFTEAKKELIESSLVM